MESQSSTEVLDSKPQPDNTDHCLVCDTEIPPGPDFCGAECEAKANAETTPAPVPPAKLTPKQIGQLRRQWVTQVNGTVKQCGHKDNFSKTEKREGKQPNNNCVHCWEAYFMTSVDLDLIHAVLTQKGSKALIAMKGTKFVRMFHGFLSTKMLPMLAAEVNKEKEAEAAAPYAPATIVGGTFGDSTARNEVQATSIAE